MRSRLLPRLARRQSRARDDGFALMVAIGLMAIAGVLVATLVAVSLREARQTGRDRQRSGAVTTAEGVVDTTLTAIQGVAVASLPCGTSSSSSTESVPDTFTTARTVTYYDSSGNAISCGDVQNSASGKIASTALIKASSTSKAIPGEPAAVRTMESLVRLSPTMANGLDKAIFGNAGVTLSNKSELYGQGSSPDADIYTNGSFACQNNEHFRGSVYAQGSITLSNSCQIDVDAWAGTGFTSDSPQSTVAGDVHVTTGSATINAGTIQGHVYAPTVSSSWCTSHSSQCTSGASGGPVRAADFPQITWDGQTTIDAWNAAGYKGYKDFPSGSCSPLSRDEATDPAEWLIKNGPSLTENTVLHTSCSFTIQDPSSKQCGNKQLCLAKNVVIFAEGGVTVTNTFTITSTDSNARLLYLIQPYNAVTTQPCTSQGINLDNQVTITSTINELLYSPCNVRKANNTDHYGQIYSGGTVQIDNQLTMYYKPLPIYGVTAATNKVDHYSADILYKRENTQ